MCSVPVSFLYSKSLLIRCFSTLLQMYGPDGMDNGPPMHDVSRASFDGRKGVRSTVLFALQYYKRAVYRSAPRHFEVESLPPTKFGLFSLSPHSVHNLIKSPQGALTVLDCE